MLTAWFARSAETKANRLMRSPWQKSRGLAQDLVLLLQPLVLAFQPLHLRLISFALSQQRFGGPSSAIGQPVLVDNVPFTVIGVAPPEFFGVDPAASPDLYLPLHTNVLVDGPRAARLYPDENFYWIEMMGRLRPGVSMAQAQAALAPRFHQWVAATATTDGERANNC